jgi:hypothetical protein
MPENQVTTSERLWSDEVGIARAGEMPGEDKPDTYEWSNGRAFKDGDGPYANNAVEGE